MSEHWSSTTGTEYDLSLEGSFHWYYILITDSQDMSFVRHYAGHVENGFDSVTDPHIGGSVNS